VARGSGDEESAVVAMQVDDDDDETNDEDYIPEASPTTNTDYDSDAVETAFEASPASPVRGGMVRKTHARTSAVYFDVRGRRLCAHCTMAAVHLPLSPTSLVSCTPATFRSLFPSSPPPF